jgi:hypothetical protein
MDFDFQTSFANKTNVELLQVVLQKDLFQPAAVAAAEKILASRNVTEEDMVMAKNAIGEKATAEEKRKERNEKLKIEASKALYSVIFPAQRTPAYFIRFFCIGFLVLWLFATIQSWRLYYYLWIDASIWAFIYTALEVITLLMIYWLFKLKKSGWVLLMIYFTFQACSSLYAIFDYHEPMFGISLQPDLTVFIFMIFISGLVFYFFNKKEVLATLKVTTEYQKKIIFFLVIPIAVLYLVFNMVDLNLTYYFSDIFVSD